MPQIIVPDNWEIAVTEKSVITRGSGSVPLDEGLVVYTTKDKLMDVLLRRHYKSVAPSILAWRESII